MFISVYIKISIIHRLDEWGSSSHGTFDKNCFDKVEFFFNEGIEEI